MVDFLVMPSSLSTSPSIRMGKKPFSSPKAIQPARDIHLIRNLETHFAPLGLYQTAAKRDSSCPLLLQSNWLETLLSAKVKSLSFDDRITLQTAIARSLYWRLYSLISVCHFRYEKVAHACFYLYWPCIPSIGTSFWTTIKYHNSHACTCNGRFPFAKYSCPLKV